MDGGNKNDQQMKLSDRDKDLIQMYLGDTLNAESKMDFDSRIGDADFKTELLHQAQMLDALAELDYLSVKEEIVDNGIPDSGVTKESDLPESQSPSNSKLSKLLVLLIPLALLLIGGWYFLNNENAPNTNFQYAELAKKYSTLYPVANIERGNNSNPDGLMNSGIVAYANNNWKKALVEFDKIISPSSIIQLYQANCHIQLEQYSDANKILDSITTSESEITDNIQWYQAICALGNSDTNRATILLEKKAKSPNSIFKTKAIKLLEELK